MRVREIDTVSPDGAGYEGCCEMDDEQKVIAGGVVTALSIVVAGALIGARILGLAIPYGDYLLVLCAMLVVAGAAVMNQYSCGTEDVSA